MPVKDTVCGLPRALSLIVSEAVALPAATGVKVRLMLQLPFTGTELGQLFLCVKALLFAPVIPINEMVRAMLPPFISVTL